MRELRGVNAQGATLEDARRNLMEMARLFWEEERSSSAALLAGKDVLREAFPV